MRKAFGAIWCVGVGLAVAGCGPLNEKNPSFDVTYGQAKAELKAMREQPAVLDRPLVFVGPFLDPGLAQFFTLNQARRYFSNDALIGGQSFLLWDTFDSCRAKTIRRVDELWPSDDPVDTVEVDVIAFSMGGLVTGYAALPPDAERGQKRRLNVRRLYTVSTPHNGADMAPLGVFNALAGDMRHGSPLIERINATPRTYELVPYVRLTDWVVGEENAAPPGRVPYWVSARPFETAHIQAPLDARILADIMRRLRNEPPLTLPDPAPLPE